MERVQDAMEGEGVKSIQMKIMKKIRHFMLFKIKQNKNLKNRMYGLKRERDMR